MKKLQFILACAALTALSSCSSDDQSFDPNEIRITTNVGGIEATTRAATDILSTNFSENVDNVNIYITEHAVSPTIFYGTSDLLTATAKSGNVLELSSKQYYPSTGNGVDVWGVYPTSIKRGNTTFSVKIDQSNEEDYKASDFLFAAGVTDHKKANGEINLQFEHQLSKVIVRLQAGQGVDPNALTEADVKIVNTIPKASFSALSQTAPTISVDNTASVQEITIGKWSGSDIAAIIVPQTVSKGTDLFKVKLANGGKYTYVIPNGDSDNDVTFSAKTVVTYTLTLTTAGIVVKSEIKDWNPGTGGSGDAVLDD